MAVGQRRPRYRRAKTRSFRLTERDATIIRHVYTHRLLDSESIIALLGTGSEQQIKRRLHLLFHNRYLDRPRAQLTTLYSQPGSTKMVYALGNHGADLLAADFGLERQAINWTAKNRAIRPRFFQHTLLVSTIMVAFEVSCRTHGDIRLIYWPEIRETTCPESTRRQKRPQTWFVHLPKVGRRGITPDKIFGLRFLDRPQGKNTAYFFLEADRGTMPVVRRSLSESSIYGKLIRYHKTFVDRIHTKRFGIKSFRVLTVTQGSTRRIESMIAATQRLEGLQGIFLFANKEPLNDILANHWLNGRGERVGLMV